MSSVMQKQSNLESKQLEIFSSYFMILEVFAQF
jgi:hypothetical protein